ncbi:MAG: nucleotide exchange factor GrpE [Alphaproteobacteria bacterium]|nr:nucleotide exchange factor GrpE [Alphaproteobacteria bacterium]
MTNINDAQNPTNDDGEDPSESRDGDSVESRLYTAIHRVAELESELASHKDQLLRQLAETENARRRAEREREDAMRYGVSALAKDLVVVADNLRRALDAAPESEVMDEKLKNLRIGVAATERELLAAFEKRGITRIDPLGEIFDPNFHEAAFEMPDPSKPQGTVIQVLQPGYLIFDRLLRPAMVGVAKGGARVDTSA